MGEEGLECELIHKIRRNRVPEQIELTTRRLMRRAVQLRPRRVSRMIPFNYPAEREALALSWQRSRKFRTCARKKSARCKPRFSRASLRAAAQTSLGPWLSSYSGPGLRAALHAKAGHEQAVERGRREAGKRRGWVGHGGNYSTSNRTAIRCGRRAGRSAGPQPSSRRFRAAKISRASQNQSSWR